MSQEYYKPVDTCYLDYHGLPKDIGTVDTETLLDLADRCVIFADGLSSEVAASKYYGVAGSALIEAMLVSERDDETMDADLATIDRGIEYLKLQADGEFQLISHGAVHPNQQDDWQKTLLQIGFANVYKDVICDEITLATKEEVILMLNRHISYANHLLAQGRADIGGLIAEDKSLLDIWTRNKRGKTDQIAFPATIRGGSGFQRAWETHDIVEATSNGNNSWSYEGIEIKKGSRMNAKVFTRYKHRITHMGKSGIVASYGAVMSA